MAERSRPALDGPASSPMPEGYGSLDEAAPASTPPPPPRPRRESRRAPDARSALAAEARLAETRAAEAAAADAKAAEVRDAEVLDLEADEAEVTVPAAGGGSSRASWRGPEVVASPGPGPGPAARAVRPETVAKAVRPETAAASAPVDEAPVAETTVEAARASDAQTAEAWAAQRREAVAESRRAADAVTTRRAPPGVPAPVQIPAAAPRVGNGVPLAQGTGRRERWGEPDTEFDDGGRRRRQKVRVVRSTSSRRLVRRLDTWTVFKVSFVFYLLALIIIVVAGVILWNVAEAFGTITSIEKSAKSLFDLSHFVIKPIPVLEYTVAGGAVLCVLGTIVNTVAALLYNLISDVAGGVQVVVVTEPD